MSSTNSGSQASQLDKTCRDVLPTYYVDLKFSTDKSFEIAIELKI